MKKSKFVKIASLVAILCILTTCVIGSTFAKYVTQDSATDDARVAKWGVEVNMGGTLFGKYYAANDAIDGADEIVATASHSVDTAASDNVVAPGTKNTTGWQVKVSGQPEVAFEVKAVSSNVKDIYLAAGSYGVMVEAYGVTAANFANDVYYVLDASTYTVANSFDSSATYYKLSDACTLADTYYPIAWSVNGGAATSNLVDVFGTIVDGINGVGQVSKVYNANEQVDNEYTLTWAWAFDQNDGADTILGNLQAGVSVVKLDGANYVAPVLDTDYSLTVGFGLTVTATQID